MKSLIINHRLAGLILTSLTLAGLLLIACQPPSSAGVTSQAASPTNTPLPPASVQSAGTPTAASTTTPATSPTVPPETEALATDTVEPPAPIPPTATPTAIQPTETVETSDTVDATLDIRPIEEISANGLPQIADITATDALLLFESSIPLACSVVYGPTTAYGQISVDQDMDGGAHTDHHPLLLGLEPDTEYHYRVQGTAPDGTLYVGEDMTFRTPPAEEQTETNFASLDQGARILAVSSNFGGAANDGAWGANGAIDGNRGTAWSSAGDGNDAFVEIELAQPAELTAVEVWTRTMSDGTAQILAFTLTTDTGEVLGPFSLEDAEQAYRFEVDAVARALRLDVVDSSGGNTGLIEFAAFGVPVTE